jgi:MFS family permease
LALFLYGLAQIAAHAQVASVGALGPMIIGAGLMALFVRHARRAAEPLLDVRLFRQRGFATGATVNLVVGTALFGVALLLPLYFEIVRGQSALGTGLLLAPQGIGAALSIGVAGYLTDKIGARPVVLVGVALALAGTGWYTQVGAHTSYAATVLALLLIGAGLGATVTPAMAAAFGGLRPADLGQATSTINVVQRVAGALGSALLAVVLQQALSTRLAGYQGSLGRVGPPGQVGHLAVSSSHAAAAVSGAFDVAFAVSFGITVLALVPAALIPRRPRRDAGATRAPTERARAARGRDGAPPS